MNMRQLIPVKPDGMPVFHARRRSLLQRNYESVHST